jgi:hypothetical protein
MPFSASLYAGDAGESSFSVDIVGQTAGGNRGLGSYASSGIEYPRCVPSYNYTWETRNTLSQITGSPSERKHGCESTGGTVDEVPEHQGRNFRSQGSLVRLRFHPYRVPAFNAQIALGSLEQDTVAIRSFGSTSVLGNRHASCLLWREIFKDLGGWEYVTTKLSQAEGSAPDTSADEQRDRGRRS